MEITEVRIKLMEDNSGSNERLQAFCSITFDDMFVIRDLKIIEGTKGFFVAMPSRKLSDRCGHCGTKNHLRSRFCNQCGSRLDESRAIRDAEGRAKLHADIAHPINSSCRELLQAAVLASYADELERSKLPGYMSRYDDFDDGDWDNAMPLPALTPIIRANRPKPVPTAMLRFVARIRLARHFVADHFGHTRNTTLLMRQHIAGLIHRAGVRKAIV